MTANPSKYPQGYFKEKECKWCGSLFKPQAPSHLYCSQDCKDNGWSNNYLSRAYSISHKDYENLEEKQEGKCAICGSEGFIINKYGFKKIVVDHDHETGKVRGLLCHNCNRGLGLFQDSSDFLRKAANYLDTSKET
jgi:hypothetical protein